MSISSISNQSQSLYQQLQMAQSFAANSPGTRIPGQTTGSSSSGGENDNSTAATSVLNAAIGQFIDSYA